MKKIFVFLLILVISTSIFAQTQVSGNQSGTWTASNSPYEVIGDISIPATEILTIESGVEVNFQGHHTLTVIGNLIAVGTETDSIFFTTDNQSTGWGGITVDTQNPNDIITLSYCKIEYGKTLVTDEYPDMNGGAMRLLSSNAVCTHSVFANNTSLPSEGMGGAIYAINTGSPSESLTFFTDCKFINNQGYSEGGAIKFTSDMNTEISNCEFINNSTGYGGGAIMFYSVVDTKIINCLFVGNITSPDSGGAIKTLGTGNTLLFKNCTMVDNTAVSGSGGAVALYYASADFVNCIIYDNTSLYDDDNIYVDAGTGSATINYSNLIMPGYNTTGNNNIQQDPLFVDADNNNFNLQETSPCVNTGTDIGLPYAGTAPDMGCYEYGLITAPYTIAYNPNPNTINVGLLGDITVIFNEDITETDLSLINIKDASNISVTGVSAQIEADNRTVTISHDDFEEYITYSVTIPMNTVQNSDLIANEKIAWNFTTGDGLNIDESNFEISIYPNPTTGIININSQNQIKKITILDISGKIILETTNTEIDLSEQQTGTYFVKIETENGVFTEKIVKK